MKEIKLSRGKTAIVDNDKFEFLNKKKWYCNNTGYACRDFTIKGKRGRVMMHRLVLKVEKKNLIVDHINRNPLDNRVANLRVCNKSQNAANSAKHKGISKYKGVSWSSKRNKWEAYITVNCKRIHLGRFKEEAEAGKKYNEYAKIYFGEFAFLNNIIKNG